MKYILPSNDPAIILQAFKNGSNNMFITRDGEKYKIFGIFFQQYTDSTLSPVVLTTVKVSDCIKQKKVTCKLILKDTDIVEVDEDMESFKQLILSGAP